MKRITGIVLLALFTLAVVGLVAEGLFLEVMAHRRVLPRLEGRAVATNG